MMQGIKRKIEMLCFSIFLHFLQNSTGGSVFSCKNWSEQIIIIGKSGPPDRFLGRTDFPVTDPLTPTPNQASSGHVSYSLNVALPMVFYILTKSEHQVTRVI